MYNHRITTANKIVFCMLYNVIHLCYFGPVFMGKNAKSRSKSFFEKTTNLEAFRADQDVQAILQTLVAEGFTKTDIINEAIRLNGRKAAVSLLERQAITAQHKWKMAQESHLARGKKG